MGIEYWPLLLVLVLAHEARKWDGDILRNKLSEGSQIPQVVETYMKVVMGNIVVSWKRSSEKYYFKNEGSDPFESCKRMYVLCIEDDAWFKGEGMYYPVC